MEIKIEYQATVIGDDGRELYQTRLCRLEVQARKLAQNWIDKETGKPDGNITLEVENGASELAVTIGKS